MAIIFIAILTASWFISNVIELRSLMKKYPKEFTQQGGFSFYRFYNTYQTLSFSEIMVKRGYLSNYYCINGHFADDFEKKRLTPLIKAELYKDARENKEFIRAKNIERFEPIGPNCLTNARLINFEFKCKEAYATYACGADNYVHEFTYTSNNSGKCVEINYKESWGIEPKRTVDTTKYYMLTSSSIFDSPKCDPADPLNKI